MTAETQVNALCRSSDVCYAANIEACVSFIRNLLHESALVDKSIAAVKGLSIYRFISINNLC